ncbi:MAG: ATP-binding cassette domain-containing protein [Verrucomicrobiota bacterium]
MSEIIADILTCDNLSVGYGERVIMDRLSFRLAPGKILAIVGPSGCGKSTLMRVLGGLDEPLGGKTTLMGVDLATADTKERESILRRTGFLFQGSALFSSLTLRENIEMPMREFLKAPRREIHQLAEYKLALVGLADAMDKLPSEISGGMAKRAGIARAMALDPSVIFLDEPSAGLDPVSSGRLDELILRIREAYGTTVILVSHEVPSILRTADYCVYLDPDTGTMGAYAPPKTLLQAGQHVKAHAFFTQARFD